MFNTPLICVLFGFVCVHSSVCSKLCFEEKCVPISENNTEYSKPSPSGLGNRLVYLFFQYSMGGNDSLVCIRELNDYRSDQCCSNNRYIKKNDTLLSLDLKFKDLEKVSYVSERFIGLIDFKIRNFPMCIRGQINFLPKLVHDSVNEFNELKNDMSDKLLFSNGTNHDVTNHDVTNHDVINHDVINHDVTNHDMTNHCVGSTKEFNASQSLPTREASLTYQVGQLISISFLLATLIVYACIKELRNHQGKSFICHVSCLLVGVTCLSFKQLRRSKIPKDICVLLVFIEQYSFLAALFWLNTLCFDKWFAVRKVRACRKSSLIKQRKKFIICSIYAWGLPLVIISITIAMYFSSDTQNDWSPQIEMSSCWFRSFKAQILYYYGLAGILLSVNAVIFILIAKHNMIFQRDITVDWQHYDPRKHNGKNRRRRTPFVRLLILMSVNWILDVLLWRQNHGVSVNLFLLPDLLNAFSGITIFVLFICNRKTLKILKKKMDGIGKILGRVNIHDSRVGLCDTDLQRYYI